MQVRQSSRGVCKWIQEKKSASYLRARRSCVAELIELTAYEFENAEGKG